MHTHRRTCRSRGFTLIELMIVVAIMGVLAGLALTGYLRYLHSARSAEARTVLGQIRNGEYAYRAETLSYLSCSTSLSDYYPNTTPDDSKWAWRRPTDSRYSSATTGWAMLNVNPDGPVRFGYAVMAGVAPSVPPSVDSDWKTSPPIFTALPSGTPWFVAAARNVQFPGGPPMLLVSASWDSTILSYNDGN